MRKVIVLLVLFVAMPAIGAFIDFDRVTTYTDASAIPAAKIPTIQYRAYYGASTTGPWVTGATVTDNQTITAPDPAPGATVWYTVDATLDGMTSAKAVPKSKTVPFQAADAPSIRSVR